MPISVPQSQQKTATQRAEEQIRELIVSGELTPDSNHLESELAERLGISRTPVREATLMLQACGLLEVQPRKGVRICAITLGDIMEICVVLNETKCLAAKLAAQQKYSADDLQPLNTCINALEAAQQANQTEDWSEHKKHFHKHVIDLSANKRISPVIINFNEQLRRVWSIAFRIEKIPNWSVPAYRNLHDEILAGNPQKAEEVMRENGKRDCEFLEAIVRKSGLKRL